MSPLRFGWLQGFLSARNALELSVFGNFIIIWVWSPFADCGSAVIRVLHVLHDPIPVSNNVARVLRVPRASHVWLHNCPRRQLLCEVCFTCFAALGHALQCMCEGELRVHVQVASVTP